MTDELLQASLRFVVLAGLLMTSTGLLWGRVFDAEPNEILRLRPIVWLGAGLVLLASLLSVWFALSRIFGPYALANLPAYMFGSQTGQLTMLRLGLLLVLLGVGNIFWLQLPLLAGLLLTLSLSSHASANGTFAILMDFVHLVAMSVWLGAVAGLAFVGNNNFSMRLARVSSIGVWAVFAMLLSGLVAALRHIFVVAVLTETSYGQAFILKMFLVLLVLLLAATNRFVLMPQKNLPKQALVLRLETLVLFFVLAASAWLGTQPPPQPAVTLRSAQQFDERLGEWRVAGEFTPNFGGLHLRLKLSLHNVLAPVGTTVSAKLKMLDHAMLPTPIVLRQSQAGVFEGNSNLWMGGNWEAQIALLGNTLRIPLRAK